MTKGLANAANTLARLKKKTPTGQPASTDDKQGGTRILVRVEGPMQGGKSKTKQDDKLRDSATTAIGGQRRPGRPRTNKAPVVTPPLSKLREGADLGYFRYPRIEYVEVAFWKPELYVTIIVTIALVVTGIVLWSVVFPFAGLIGYVLGSISHVGRLKNDQRY